MTTKTMKSLFFSGLLAINLFIITTTTHARDFPDFTGLVEEVKDSVVSIKVDITEGGVLRGQSGGSGFIIDTDGYLLTNHHVIEGGGNITVKFNDNREYDAEIIGSDAATDVALLKISNDDKRFKAIPLGSSDTLKVGEWVLAFGAPFNLEQTVTAGIVSAKGRGDVGSQYVPFIQTDVAINRGNSGGPLINLDGEVVGINSMVFNPMLSSGLSFSIPVGLVDNVRKQLLEFGEVKRGYLGITFAEIDQDKAEFFKLPAIKGALVTRVLKGRAGEKAGLNSGDVVTHVNGQLINKAQDLPFYVGQIAPGEKVSLQVIRDGERETFKAVLDSATGSAELAQNQPVQQDNALGLKVEALPAELQQTSGIEMGVLVSDVESGSPAAKAGVRKGDVILKLHRHTIRSVSDYINVLKQLPKRGKVGLLMARPGQGADFIVLEL